MKTILIAGCVLCAVTAVGQTGVAALQNQPVVLQLPDHPEHAEAHGMAAEQSIMSGGSNAYTVMHGERPLWEFGPITQQPSLGDVARAFRREKLTAKKAEIIFEKQGS